MKLKQFRYLVAIAEHGSIAKAARALYISQPSISQSMKELEEELGFPVLVRDRIGTTFTLQGQEVLTIAQNIIRELNKLDKIVGNSGDAIWGHLVLGGTPYFADSLLLNTIVKLRTEYPNLVIRLEEHSSQNILDMLHNGSINIGIMLSCNVDDILFKSKLRDYDLQANPLFNDEMVFVAAQEHPLAQNGAATMKEILSYPVIQYRSDINNMTLQLFQQYKKDPDLLYIDDFNSLWRLPLIGPYLFISPLKALHTHMQSGLRPVHIKDFDYHCTVSWVHSNESLSDAEKEVVATIHTFSEELLKE